MDITQRLDPELAALIRIAPEEGMFDWEDLEGTRSAFAQRTLLLRDGAPDIASVQKEDLKVTGSEDSPEVAIRVYKPKERGSAPIPGLLWIPGGGFVIGSIEQNDLIMQHIVEEIGCMVVSVEYRRAPENPFPAPVEDCYSALRWMADNASEICLDPSRIAVGGASAGGGLSAGITLMARDHGEVAIAFQMLIYPMLDDRNVTHASQEITDPRVWNRRANLFGWSSYLGEDMGGDDVSSYAAPSRAADLSNLPPTYIAVGAQDLFVDEDMEFAQRLIQAGVTTELHVYPGAFHGFDGSVPDAAVSKRFIADRTEALRKAFEAQD